MAEAGVAIAAARNELVRDLTRGAGPGVRRRSRAPRLAMAGEVEGWLPGVPALEAEERFALAARRQPRAPTPRPAGPPWARTAATSRSPIDRTGEPAARCSTGRQKALLVSIVLAQAALRRRRSATCRCCCSTRSRRTSTSARRAALFESSSALGAQCWITGTDAAFFAPLGGRAQICVFRRSSNANAWPQQ